MNLRPELVNQIDDRTCGHACLAMVSGLPIEEIIRQVGPEDMSFDREAMFLASQGFLVERLTVTQPWGYGTYFLTVPSLNLPGRMHRMVLFGAPDIDETFPWILRDPQTGREGRKWYTTESLRNGEISYSEVTLLRPTGLQHLFYRPDPDCLAALQIAQRALNDLETAKRKGYVEAARTAVNSVLDGVS